MSIVEDVRGAIASREPGVGALCAKVREMWPGLCVDVRTTIMTDVLHGLREAWPGTIGGGGWAALWSWMAIRADWVDADTVTVCSEACASEARQRPGARVVPAHPGETCPVCMTTVDAGPLWSLLTALAGVRDE
jgi:hypothetical protein